MNTSSSEGSIASSEARLVRGYGAIAASSAASSRPDTCRLVPNGATMSMPGVPSSSLRELRQSLASSR